MAHFHLMLATYTCHGRYGPAHPCSAIEYFAKPVLFVVCIIVAAVGAMTHQGYRYRSGRGSMFERRSLFAEEAERRETEELAGEAMVAQAREQHGLPPLGLTGTSLHKLPGSSGHVPTEWNEADGSGWALASSGAPLPARDAPLPHFAAEAPVAPAPAATPAVPPGWYPDPEHAGQQRYWLGTTWAPSTPPQ